MATYTCQVSFICKAQIHNWTFYFLNFKSTLKLNLKYPPKHIKQRGMEV